MPPEAIILPMKSNSFVHDRGRGRVSLSVQQPMTAIIKPQRRREERKRDKIITTRRRDGQQTSQIHGAVSNVD